MIEIIPNWHPVFVHFTVALLAMAVLLSLLNPFLREGRIKEQLRIVARWNLWFGTALAVFTVLAGWVAYNTVAHDAPAHVAMTEHRDWALATLLAFLGLTVWSILDTRSGRKPAALFSALLFAGGLLLANTAWHGAELVYRHGLGVMSLPKAEGEGHHHDHEHAGDEDHDHGASTPAAGDAADHTEQGMPHDHPPGGTAAGNTEAPAPAQPASPTQPHTHADDGHTHEH